MAASSSLRVGFVGAGKMASALARGFVEGGAVASASHISASCPVQDSHLLKDFERMGCGVSHSNLEVVSEADVILMAVKPNVVATVLEEVGPALKEKSVVVSIAAGIRLDQLQSGVKNADAKIVRLMPNTPCVVREGASVYTRGSAASADDGARVKNLFEAVGQCHEVSEALIDVVTAVSGSGPAYMYLILEALADGAVKQGLPRALAYRLAAQTMVGAGKMVLDTRQHPAVLKDEVCSPGGTTMAALHTLEKAGLRTALIQAVEAATEKCQELQQLNNSK